MNKLKTPKKVLVGISGGMASFVTAALLKNQGFQLLGLQIKVGNSSCETSSNCQCCRGNELAAKLFCEKLEIPLHIVNLSGQFTDEVIDHLVHERLQQRTPIICVPCDIIKFAALSNKAQELKCDFIATGHYAQIVSGNVDGFAKLYEATDKKRDQSYFLFNLDQEILKRTLMPLGGVSGAMVQKIAADLGIAGFAENMGESPCFMDGKIMKEFINSHSGRSFRPKGIVRTVAGMVVGEHEGLHAYTIGEPFDYQTTEKIPHFVIGYEVPNQTLVIGPEKHLYCSTVIATGAKWMRPINEIKELKCKAKTAPGAPRTDCFVTIFENSIVKVHFVNPQRSVIPGHPIVFYNDAEVIGGGYIQRIGGV